MASSNKGRESSEVLYMMHKANSLHSWAPIGALPGKVRA